MENTSTSTPSRRPRVLIAIIVVMIVVVIAAITIMVLSPTMAPPPGTPSPATVDTTHAIRLPGAVSPGTTSVGYKGPRRAPLVINWTEDAGQLWKDTTGSECEYNAASGLKFAGLPNTADRTIFGLPSNQASLTFFEGGLYSVTWSIDVRKYQRGDDFAARAHLVLNYGNNGHDLGATSVMDKKFSQLSGALYPHGNESDYTLKGGTVYNFSPGDTITLVLTLSGWGSCPSVAWRNGVLRITPV